jgi:predicted RNA-binding Zn ribbon-like protein
MVTKEQPSPTNEKLCLDFANTADWHASDHPEESLNSYADVVAWARGAGLVSEVEAERLRAGASVSSMKAEEVLRRAVELRDAIYEVFAAVAHHRPVARRDVDVLNQALSQALAHQRLRLTDGGFTWEWMGGGEALDWILWPVAVSAAALLTSPLLSRVGQCSDDRGCGWLFLDTSRNHSRRWCDMKDCGNRAKLRRFYARSRGKTGGRLRG